MDSEKLVESCPFINMRSIKRDLLRYKENKGDISGIIDIGHNNKVKECNYWFDNEDDKLSLMVSSNGSEPQNIIISEQKLSFGIRHYFVCGCGKRVCKLFMPDNKTQFRCRSCYGLYYELSMINRNSKQGMLFYMTNRKLKLINQQATINRMFYNGQFSKRYKRFLKLCHQAGLNNTVENARELINAIRGQSI